MRRLVIPIVILLGLFAWLVYRSEQKKNSNVYSGTIEARDADIGSLMGGRVSEVLVEEGDSVQAGETLVRFDRYLPVSYTHLRAHETPEHLVCRLLLEKK